MLFFVYCDLVSQVFPTHQMDDTNEFHQIDYKISRVKKGESITEVKLKNKGQVNGPIPVSVMDNGQIRETKWLDSQKGWVSFEGTVSELMIDPNRQILELNRSNNSWKQKRILNKLEPIKPKFLFGYNRTGASQARAWQR